MPAFAKMMKQASEMQKQMQQIQAITLAKETAAGEMGKVTGDLGGLPGLM